MKLRPLYPDGFSPDARTGAWGSSGGCRFSRLPPGGGVGAAGLFGFDCIWPMAENTDNPFLPLICINGSFPLAFRFDLSPCQSEFPFKCYYYSFPWEKSLRLSACPASPSRKMPAPRRPPRTRRSGWPQPHFGGDPAARQPGVPIAPGRVRVLTMRYSFCRPQVYTISEWPKVSAGAGRCYGSDR